MKTAHIQWVGDHVIVADEKNLRHELFSMSVNQPHLIRRLIGRAKVHGYSLPQIYADSHGKLRIWL